MGETGAPISQPSPIPEETYGHIGDRFLLWPRKDSRPAQAPWAWCPWPPSRPPTFSRPGRPSRRRRRPLPARRRPGQAGRRFLPGQGSPAPTDALPEARRGPVPVPPPERALLPGTGQKGRPAGPSVQAGGLRRERRPPERDDQVRGDGYRLTVAPGQDPMSIRAYQRPTSGLASRRTWTGPGGPGGRGTAPWPRSPPRGP